MIKVCDIHLGRNVRKQLRRGHEQTTADTPFQRVAEECRAGREPRWLTDTLLETMVRLHQAGWAHSIEVWQDRDLIGGAIGIGAGPALSGDVDAHIRRCLMGRPVPPPDDLPDGLPEHPGAQRNDVTGLLGQLDELVGLHHAHCGCGQRTRASNPATSPLVKATMGW